MLLRNYFHNIYENVNSKKFYITSIFLLCIFFLFRLRKNIKNMVIDKIKYEIKHINTMRKKYFGVYYKLYLCS